MNWLVTSEDLRGIVKRGVTAKFRYRQKETEVELFFKENNTHQLKVVFDSPLRAITPGQYAAFYRQEICLGGGVIHSTEKLDEFSNPLFNLHKEK